MTAKLQNLIDYFKCHNGIVRFADIIQAGFHPDILKAAEKENRIEKMSRGLYRLTDYNYGSHPDLVEASLQAPRGIICLISALAFHEATTEIPKHVDMAIPRKTHANRIQYPPVKFYRFAPEVWTAGVGEYEIEGQKIKVYSLAKTIADCFKFRNKIGANVALDALKFAINEKNIKPKEIMQYAKICRVDGIIKPILEAII